MDKLTREDCTKLDREDPVSKFRDEFALPENTIYLDGNSLGALPRTTIHQMKKTVEEDWGMGLIRSWNEAEWITMPQRLGDKIAPLIGAKPGEVVVVDSTSVNLFKV
ncbi:MAG: kynureninase, partial [bacterium]